MTRKALIPIMTSSAAALATALWAGSASAGHYKYALIHQAENFHLCLNVPYQDISNGKPLVVNRHCNYPGIPSDSATSVKFDRDQVVLTPDWNTGSKCMDNSQQFQRENNPIVVWDCNGGPAQQWDVYDDGHYGHYEYTNRIGQKLISKQFHLHVNHAFCLSVRWGDPNTGGDLVLAHCNGQGNQSFVIATTEGYEPPSGWYCQTSMCSSPDHPFQPVDPVSKRRK